MPSYTVKAHVLQYLLVSALPETGQTLETPEEVGTRWQWKELQVCKCFIQFCFQFGGLTDTFQTV